MPKLRHVAFAVRDPEATARFYEEVFDMRRVGETHTSLADGIYLTDGVVTLAVLKYHLDEVAGHDRNEVRINHIGFHVEDMAETQDRIEANGGHFFFDLPDDKNTLYYEKKFKDPEGIIFDITHKGWAR